MDLRALRAAKGVFFGRSDGKPQIYEAETATSAMHKERPVRLYTPACVLFPAATVSTLGAISTVSRWGMIGISLLLLTAFRCMAGG